MTPCTFVDAARSSTGVIHYPGMFIEPDDYRKSIEVSRREGQVGVVVPNPDLEELLNAYEAMDMMRVKYEGAMRSIAATIQVVESGAYDAQIILKTLWPEAD